MSASKTHDSDIAAMCASAALAISGIPFNGPLGAARVGFSEDGQYILNPTFDALSDSRLDMVVAGIKDAVLMVGSQTDELTEEQMLGAVMFAHQEFQVAIDAIGTLARSSVMTLGNGKLHQLMSITVTNRRTVSATHRRAYRFLKR